MYTNNSPSPKIENTDYNNTEYAKYIFGDIRTSEPFDDNFEAKALLDRVAAGDKAASNEFYERFAGFVRERLMKEFPDFRENHFADMFNEVWLYILTKCSLYNPHKSKVTTFFYKYMRHAAIEYISKHVNGKTILRAQQIRTVRKAIEAIQQETGTEPDDIQLALYTGYRASTISKIRKDMEPSLSLDMMREIGEDDTLEDITVSGNPAAVYIYNETMSEFENAIMNLPDNLREVLIRKHGLFGNEAQTEKDISDELGIPVQDISRLDQRAQFTLRMSAKVRSLYDREKEISKDMGGESVATVPTYAAMTMIAAIESDDDSDEEVF